MKLASFLLASALHVALLTGANAANPFLDAPDDRPLTAAFKGTEWGDDIGGDDLPLRAKVVTNRVAKAAWGGVYKITFQEMVSKASERREIQPLYFIVTDDWIALLNEQNPEQEAQRIAALAEPPKVEPDSIYGLSKGHRKATDDLTQRKLTVRGDASTYAWSHNSGHFTTVIWKKGVGLQEYAQGRGAHADGFRLTRVSAPGKGK